MPHIFVVQLDIPAEDEAEFNRIYDTEHFPMLAKVPGVRSAARYRLDRSTVDRKSTRLNSSHATLSRMPSSA